MIDGQMERIICAILKAESILRRGKRQNRRGFCDPAETARIQRQRDHRGLHENEGQPVGLSESVRCGASGGKHSYHSPKRGEYKNVLAALFKIEEKGGLLMNGTEVRTCETHGSQERLKQA